MLLLKKQIPTSHESLVAMSLKLQRSTKNATTAASEKASLRREQVIEEIRYRIFDEWCTCGKCYQGDYSSLCKSYKYIADTANTLRIETPRGKVGTWQAASVSNLFKVYKQE